MSIDTQALRKLAVDAKELAIIKRYTKGVEAQKKFIAEMTPATVLALLDELEGEAGRIKELESQRALAFMACNRWRDKCVEAEAKMEAAEARIAELEAREVELPPLVDCSNVPFAAHSWNAYRAEAVKALRAAGISVKGE